ncbi:hypothetical protein [Parafrankia elaeagni]|uniref:hypothetical protein n=1 Tax=Parafrankia elaeagni TaxID=222534 RepID=UPI00037B89AE|nr:hypothetical protein [Parafrankia elaeagni]
MDLTTSEILIMLSFPLLAMIGMLMMSRLEQNLSSAGRAVRAATSDAAPATDSAPVDTAGTPSTGPMPASPAMPASPPVAGGSVAAAAAGLLDP